ncbi:uncharacterized protein LOC143171765 [Aptenodytes patagonicus]|uniref:uncharacterized protein LOC143171765 n=1 Tax=Aptenodytes patagonicus TaxID=9234 RepID=UPI003F9FBF22
MNLNDCVPRCRAEKHRGDEQKPQRRGTKERGWTSGSPEAPSTPNPSPKGCREFDKGFAGTLEPCEVRRKHVAETRSKQALLFLVVTLTSMEPSHTTSGTRADAPAGALPPSVGSATSRCEEKGALEERWRLIHACDRLRETSAVLRRPGPEQLRLSVLPGAAKGLDPPIRNSSQLQVQATPWHLRT